MTSQDVILGILMSESRSGYDIKSRLEQMCSYFFDASFGTIYPMLAKMEKEGWITKESVQQEGKPNKNVYTITDKGRERFRIYMESSLAHEVLRSDLLVRLQFGEFVEPGLAEQWFGESIRHTEELLNRLEAARERCGAPNRRIVRTSIEYGIEMNIYKLDRLKAAMEKLKSSV